MITASKIDAFANGFDRLAVAQKALENQRDAMAESLRVFDIYKRADGLTPDHIKRSVEYRSAKARYDAAHEALRAFNGKYLKLVNAEREGRASATRYNGKVVRHISNKAGDGGQLYVNGEPFTF